MPPKKIIFNTGARKFRFFWRRESESASLQLLGWSGNTGDRPSRKNNSAVETLCEWSSWCGHKRSIGRTLMQKNCRTHLYLFGLNPFGFVGIVGHVTGPTELLWRRQAWSPSHKTLWWTNQMDCYIIERGVSLAQQPERNGWRRRKQEGIFCRPAIPQ